MLMGCIGMARGLRMRRFHHTFLCALKVDIAALRKQASEVEALALVPLAQVAEECYGPRDSKRYVPHGAAYYKTIVQAITKCLG